MLLASWLLLPVAVATTPVPSTPSDSPTPDAADAPPWTRPPPVDITVIDQGTRRRRLALRPRAADRWQLQVQRTASTVVDGEREESPATVIDTEVVVAAGTITVRPHTADVVGAPPEGLAAVRAAAVVLGGDAPPTAPVDPAQRQPPTSDPGALDELAAELHADLVWSLGATAVPLPTERVGPGARWSWTREEGDAGVALSQTWTATLIARTGRQAQVDVVLTGDAPDREGVSLSGGGTVWLDLTRPLARAADLALRIEIDVPQPDGQPEASAALIARVVVATREAPPPAGG